MSSVKIEIIADYEDIVTKKELQEIELIVEKWLSKESLSIETNWCNTFSVRVEEEK